MAFPSLADDYRESSLRLDDPNVHPSATYFLKMIGVAMEPTSRPNGYRELLALFLKIACITLVQLSIDTKGHYLPPVPNSKQ